MVYNVVFLQGDEADRALEILKNFGEGAAMEHLIDYDCGEYGEGQESTSAGADDSVYRQGEYIMSYNTRIGYIGLEKDDSKAISAGIEKGLLRTVNHPAVSIIESSLYGNSYRCNNGLVVIQGWDILDGEYWVHTSFSRKSRIPEYKDMKFVKEVFIGDDYHAIMVLPEKSQHINFHEYTLHFYTCVTNREILPDFTHGLGII